MSICRCERCERLVDTDFEEGYWDDMDFYCDNCADILELYEDNGNGEHCTIGWQNLPAALRRR